ncbi:MAG: CoA ester lyase [Gammaproteobacteria bacterium]|nr:CoA ester lyase [Gammaproteobacteria bacterium]
MTVLSSSVNRPFRLQRSMLSVPAINTHMFEKALSSEADVIMLDCEDSVAIDDKQRARENVINAMSEQKWKSTTKGVVIRINGSNTPFMYKDLIQIVESVGEHIDSILLPKVNEDTDVKVLECLLNQLETHLNLTNTIGIEVLVETAQGAENLSRIAACSDRLEALHFGAGDFAASCRARMTLIGGDAPDYPGDQWHYIMQKIVIAARANGLRPIDSAFGDYHDEDGYVQKLQRAVTLGFEGKWAIHPKQIAAANKVMTPPISELKNAQRIISAMDEAAKRGRGAASLDGQMIDVASVKMAQHIVDTNRAIRTKG